MCFYPKIRLPVPKIVSCESTLFKPKFLHIRLFLSKNRSEMVYFKKFERIFCHFLTKMHIFAINRHLKKVES